MTLYVRFPLSLRNLEDLLAQRAIVHEGEVLESCVTKTCRSAALVKWQSFVAYADCGEGTLRKSETNCDKNYSTAIYFRHYLLVSGLPATRR